MEIFNIIRLIEMAAMIFLSTLSYTSEIANSYRYDCSTIKLTICFIFVNLYTIVNLVGTYYKNWIFRTTFVLLFPCVFIFDLVTYYTISDHFPITHIVWIPIAFTVWCFSCGCEPATEKLLKDLRKKIWFKVFKYTLIFLPCTIITLSIHSCVHVLSMIQNDIGLHVIPVQCSVENFLMLLSIYAICQQDYKRFLISNLLTGFTFFTNLTFYTIYANKPHWTGPCVHQVWIQLSIINFILSCIYSGLLKASPEWVLRSRFVMTPIADYEEIN
jgi:hypothetical protein